MKLAGSLLSNGTGFDEFELSIETALSVLRKHLNMEIGFISEFFDDRRSIRYVDAESKQDAVNVGDSFPLIEGYCEKIVHGELPELIPDTATVAAARAIPFTTSIPVGAHIGVPIRLPSGQLYGTLCYFRPVAEPSLNARDLSVVRVVADLIGRQLARSEGRSAARAEDFHSIQMALKNNLPNVVFQSIVDLNRLNPIGYECLSRFGSKPARPPNLWFDLADSLGLGVDLESTAVRKGIQELGKIPASSFLAVNCSPSMIRSGRLGRVLDGLPLERIVVEVTEHAVVDDFSGLRTLLAPLRERGLRTAMDDAGSGYGNLRHLIEMGPDFIKLDGSFARAVDKNPSTRAMVAAIVAFANETGSTVIAEGIEDSTTLGRFRTLGVHFGQGFHFSRPVAIDMAIGQGAGR